MCSVYVYSVNMCHRLLWHNTYTVRVFFVSISIYLMIYHVLSPAAPKKIPPSISTKRLRVNSWPDSSCLEKAPGGTIMKKHHDRPWMLNGPKPQGIWWFSSKNSDVKQQKGRGRRCPQRPHLDWWPQFPRLGVTPEEAFVEAWPTWRLVGIYGPLGNSWTWFYYSKAQMVDL